MALFSRNARKFTTAESFQLYMEGLRSLQLYEEMQSDSSVDHPASRTALDDRLNDAHRNLSECVGKYPSDILPLYYYAIMLTTQAQRVEAVQLQDYLADSAMPPWPSEGAEKLYQESATEFRNVVAKSHGEVRRFAEYNLAQVLARMANPTRWDEAFKLLRHLRGKRHSLRDNLSPKLLLRSIGQFWSRDGGPETTGRTASAATSLAEKNAFQAQVQMLMDFVKLRQAARDRNLRMAWFPLPMFLAQEPPAEFSNATRGRLADFQISREEVDPLEKQPLHPPSFEASRAVQDLHEFVSTLDQRVLPSQAKADLTADYWNKWSRLALECAVFAGETEQEIGRLLDLAGDYAETAIQLKGKAWTPALLSRSFARALAQGNAQPFLAAIVGHEPIQPAPPPPQTPDPNEIAKYILAMPLGTPASTIANLVLRAFGRLDAGTLQQLVRALDHAKLKMELIDEITRTLEA